MVRDRFGNAIATLLIFDDIFCSNYAKIGTPKVVNEIYEKIHKHEWVKKIDKVEIPYYNQDDDKTHSLRIEIKPTTEILNKFLKLRKQKYITEYVKLDLLEYIKTH